MQVRIRNVLVNVDFASAPVELGPTDLQNRIATARFVYESLQNPSLDLVPKTGDLVEIRDDVGTASLFFGHVAQVTRGGDPVGRRYAISCQDLHHLFDLLRLPADFTYAAGLNDRAIVQDLIFVNAGWGGANQTPAKIIGFLENLNANAIVAKAQGLPAVTLKAGASVTEALNQISALVGGVAWWLEPPNPSYLNAVLHWNDVGTVAALALTTSPDIWPVYSNYFYNYSEFVDRTTHYHRVRVDNGGGGLSATADDWAAFADQRAQHVIEGATTGFTATDGVRILEGARVSDSTLTTQAQVTQRAYQELNKGRIRRTITLTFDRSAPTGGAPITVGMLVDVVHAVWGDSDLDPVSSPAPHISREVPIHSNIRGELVPGSRGRYVVQKVTPRLRAKGSSALYSYDLELGDYQDSLAATLAAVV